MTTVPQLPSVVGVADGLDVADLFDRFEIFEALHHGLTIANPMSSMELDQVIDLLGPKAHDDVLDLACGTGELVLRCADRAPVRGLGVDLSPWMLARAVIEAERRDVDSVDWLLADARSVGVGPHSIVACLGASWVWHGIRGTIRAVSDRTCVGGRIAVGDMLRRDDVSAERAAVLHGSTPGSAEVLAAFEENRIEPIGVVVTTDEQWNRYIADTAGAVERWAVDNPGDRASRWLDEHHEWVGDQQRDREILAWTVWVGQRRD